jgi:hypothetical protein
MTAETETAVGTAIPLLLNFREVLFGNGIVLEVHAVNGRALCVHETDGHWIYGVNPGGMSAFGEDAASARREFRATFSGTMREIATECASFDEFENAVKDFFRDTNRGYQQAWLDAVSVVRSGAISVEGLVKSPADAPLVVTVSTKSVAELQTTDNEANLQLDLAA